MNAKLI